MSDLWLNCTYAKCTVSIYFNSWCLKNLRVESGIIELQVKLHHHRICLHICFSEPAKQLLQPLTLTRHPANLPSVCHDALGARDWTWWGHKCASCWLAFCTWDLWATLALHPSQPLILPLSQQECRISLYSFLVHLSENIAMMTVTSGEMLNKHSQSNFKEV